MNHKQFPEPLEALLLILLTFGAVLIGGFFVIFLFLNPESLAKSSKAVLIIGSIPLLLVPLIYSKIRRYDIVRLFRLRPVSMEIVLFSILIGFSVAVVGDEIDRIVQIFLPMPPELMDGIIAGLQAETALDWVLLILGAVIIASIAEEMIFRGFFQVTLEMKGDITRAVMIASFTWTITHLNIYWMIQIFIMGVIIGFLAWRTGSIIPPIIVHGINNLLSLIWHNFGDETDWFELGSHVSPFILIPSILVLILSLRHLTLVYGSERND